MTTRRRGKMDRPTSTTIRDIIGPDPVEPADPGPPQPERWAWDNRELEAYTVGDLTMGYTLHGEPARVVMFARQSDGRWLVGDGGQRWMTVASIDQAKAMVRAWAETAPEPVASDEVETAQDLGTGPPRWAPQRGSWVRGVHIGRTDRVATSDVWHLSDVVWRGRTSRAHTLRPLCGRDIRIDPATVPEIDPAAVGLGRLATFETSASPSRRCGHCVRYADLRGITIVA